MKKIINAVLGGILAGVSTTTLAHDVQLVDANNNVIGSIISSTPATFEEVGIIEVAYPVPSGGYATLSATTDALFGYIEILYESPDCSGQGYTDFPQNQRSLIKTAIVSFGTLYTASNQTPEQKIIYSEAINHALYSRPEECIEYDTPLAYNVVPVVTEVDLNTLYTPPYSLAEVESKGNSGKKPPK